MASFAGPLDARQLKEPCEAYPSGLWELLSDLVYKTDVLPGLTIPVPKGFVTDFASVPRLPLAYLITGGYGNAAAVIHDFLYQTHLVPEDIANQIFYEALLVLGVSKWRAWMMYHAVAQWGASPYESGPSRFTVLNPK